MVKHPSTLFSRLRPRYTLQDNFYYPKMKMFTSDFKPFQSITLRTVRRGDIIFASSFEELMN
ncbi:hypothetical protein VCR26J2_350413 [Vibrio coralliirubri]|nr:hypothetical protein VCR26J2_350413 [Vibrio coralliirubri]